MPAPKPLVVIGTAVDGPLSEIVTPRTWDAALTIFGGRRSEQHTITATATSLTLDYASWGSVETFRRIRSVWKPHQLYGASISGNRLSFGSVGGTGADLQVFYRPDTGWTDLVSSAEGVLLASSATPSMLRVGGEYATLSLGEWEFVSKYAGNTYNQTFLTVTATSMVITAPFGKWKTRTYRNDLSALERFIEQDYVRGYIPIYLSVAPHTTNLPVGTYYLTGGADGELNETSLGETLSVVDLNSVGAIYIAGPCTPTLYDIVNQYVAVANRPPLIAFTNSPTIAASESTSAYVYRMYQEVPYRSDFVVAAVGSAVVNYTDARRVRLAGEVMAGAYNINPDRSPSNVGTHASGLLPRWSSTELVLLHLNGFLALNRFIGSDVSTYRGVSFSGYQDFPYMLAVQDTIRKIVVVTTPYVGSIISSASLPNVEDQLRGALVNIPYAVLQTVTVAVVQSAMFVNATVHVNGEVVSIGFTVQVAGLQP